MNDGWTSEKTYEVWLRFNKDSSIPLWIRLSCIQVVETSGTEAVLHTNDDSYDVKESVDDVMETIRNAFK